MNRRHFVARIASATVMLPAAAAAQQRAGRIGRIGFLSPQSAASAAPLVAAFRAGLAELGWIEGQNIRLELRYADGEITRLPDLAAELVALGIDALVVGSNPGVLAAKQVTRTVPIVMVTTGDPVAGGLVRSLAQPGENVTGVTSIAQDLSAKRLELLREVVPDLRRVAALANPDSPYTPRFSQDAQLAARSFGIELLLFEARSPADLATVFARMRQGGAQALMVNADIMFITHRAQIAALAEQSRLPAVYWERAFVGAGGLMFYGAGLRDLYRNAATYVDKVLKGARPADLPVEQPTRFELVLNLKAAKALGLVVPPSILLRADEVVE
jgi:putative ABC transport system substrate-binding protein